MATLASEPSTALDAALEGDEEEDEDGGEGNGLVRGGGGRAAGEDVRSRACVCCAETCTRTTSPPAPF
jgi:hypothetical protein